MTSWRTLTSKRIFARGGVWLSGGVVWGTWLLKARPQERSVGFAGELDRRASLWREDKNRRAGRSNWTVACSGQVAVPRGSVVVGSVLLAKTSRGLEVDPSPLGSFGSLIERRRNA
jgi:hypothetical protein